MLTVKLPQYTIGENVLIELGSIATKYGKRVLIVGRKQALAITKATIEKSLKEKRISMIDCLWYGGECSYKNIEIICEQIKANDADLIIGVGGGKALDTAKASAAKMEIPVITVPTIASTCAATTSLSIIYTDQGDYETIYLYEETPPAHIFISIDILAKAPIKYLWAGIGDTISKYYEVDIASRGARLSHSEAMGKKLSVLCAEPLISYGAKALEDNQQAIVSFELQEVVLNIIITTGIVSMLVGENYVSACAHGLFYGLTILEEIEKYHLHGEVVAYGVLVLLMLDEQYKEVEKLMSFYRKVELPTSLKDMNIENNKEILDGVLDKAVSTEDHQKMPYEVSKDMFYEAIQKVEILKK